MKTRIIFLTLVFVFAILFGCKKQEDIVPSPQKADSEEQHTKLNPVDVTIDPVSGQPTASNYKEPASDEKEPRSSSATARIGSRIISERTVQVGTAPSAALEANAILPGVGEVLTGIGLRVDGDRVTALRVRSRVLNADGSLSLSSFTRNVGISPTLPMEAWFEVPYGHVITGIGTRVAADNVVNLRVTYKKIKRTHMLEGSFVASVGAIAGAFTEVQFTTGSSDKQVITGVGFTCSADNITTMRLIVGELKVPIINSLQLRIVSGGDDLRGGNDNVNAHIHFKNGTVQSIYNINRSGNFPNWSERIATLNLNAATPINQISRVRLQTTFSGGTFGDNWNMDRLEITAFGYDLPGALPRVIFDQSGAPLFRFTGGEQNFSAHF